MYSEEYSISQTVRYKFHLHATSNAAIRFIERIGSSPEQWHINLFRSGKTVSNIVPRDDRSITPEIIEAMKENSSMVGGIDILYGTYKELSHLRHTYQEEHAVIIRIPDEEKRAISMEFITEYSNPQRWNIDDIRITENVLFVVKTLTVMGIEYGAMLLPTVKKHDIECVKQWEEYFNRDH